MQSNRIEFRGQDFESFVRLTRKIHCFELDLLILLVFIDEFAVLQMLLLFRL